MSPAVPVLAVFCIFLICSNSWSLNWFLFKIFWKGAALVGRFRNYPSGFCCLFTQEFLSCSSRTNEQRLVLELLGCASVSVSFLGNHGCWYLALGIWDTVVFWFCVYWLFQLAIALLLGSVVDAPVVQVLSGGFWAGHVAIFVVVPGSSLFAVSWLW